jgi:hypothetical protein
MTRRPLIATTSKAGAPMGVLTFEVMRDANKPALGWRLWLDRLCIQVVFGATRTLFPRRIGFGVVLWMGAQWTVRVMRRRAP